MRLSGSATGVGGGWGLRAAVAGVLVVLGIAIGWGLYGNTSSPLSFTSDPGAKSDGIPANVITPPKQLQSLGGLTGLLEQMRQRFGDTMGFGLTIYSDYAVLTRPDPADDRRKLSYSYRGGFDDPSASTKSDNDVQVDLGAFDVKTVVVCSGERPRRSVYSRRTSRPTAPTSASTRRTIRSHPARSNCGPACPATSAAGRSPSPVTAPSSASTAPPTNCADLRYLALTSAIPCSRLFRCYRCSVVYIGAIQLADMSKCRSDRAKGVVRC